MTIAPGKTSANVGSYAYLASRWLAAPGVRWPYLALVAMVVPAVASRALSGSLNLEPAIFFWTHAGLALLGVETGRLILKKADGVGYAMSTIAPTRWWVRLLGLLLAGAALWLATAFAAFTINPFTPVARLFIAAAGLAAFAGFGAGAALAARPGWAVWVPLFAWGLFHFACATEAASVGKAQVQVTFSAAILLPSLLVSWLAHVRHLRG